MALPEFSMRTLLEANNVNDAKKLLSHLPKEARPAPADLDEARGNPQRYLQRVKLANAGQGISGSFLRHKLIPALSIRGPHYMATFSFFIM